MEDTCIQIVILQADIIQDCSVKRMKHLLLRIDRGVETGSLYFKESDEQLDNCSIRKMLAITSRILRGVSYNKIKEVRKSNYQMLHESLF